MGRPSVTPEDMQVGTVHKTNGFGDMFISSYVTGKEVVVRFPGYTHEVVAQAGSIRRGQVKNFMYPALWGKGFLGLGDYSNLKHKKAYSVWSGVVERCYSEKFHTKQPTYKKCTIAAEWLNFQVFAKWFYEESNYEDGLYLDKDLIAQGNKVYSNSTCVFVSREVNSTLTDHGAARGPWKLGVTYHKSKKRFGANYSVLGKRIHIGYYKNEEDAHEDYKRAKYTYLKELAEKQTNESIKQGLLNWVIPEY